MYVDLNELRIQRECLYALRKRAIHSFLLLLSSLPLSIYLCFPLRSSPPPYQSHRCKDPTADAHFWLRLLSPVTSVVDSQCCCFLKCGVRGSGGCPSFLFLTWEGGRYVRATFPHLGVTKHTSCCPVPFSPSPSLTSLSSLLLPPSSPFVSVCVHCVNHCPC